MLIVQKHLQAVTKALIGKDVASIGELLDKIEQLQAENERLKQQAGADFRNGYKNAVCDFAWWKDGVQYVGCGVKTLKQVIEQLDNQALKGGGQVEKGMRTDKA